MTTPQSTGLMQPGMNALRALALAGAASLALFALPAQARPAPVSGVVNGSFEQTTTPGVWVAAASWTEVSGLDAAYSLPTGTENIPATAGSRFLRLQTEGNGYIARVAQNLGAMVAGETYTFRADVIASTTYGPYGATAAFVNEGTVAPTTTYATQTVSVAQGATGGFILSYTAQSADDGRVLYIWLESVPQTQGYSRGGIDRARLDGQPEPPAVPSAPSPANGAGVAGVSPTLTWASDPLAITYQVALGPVGEALPAAVEVNDPTWTPPGALLSGVTYQWQVVAVNANGSTPGPVWTFTTGVIPFTYVYEPDSAPPNVPAELAAPYMLNDGLIGTGWDAMTQLYSLPPYAYPVPKIPYVTLTLAPNSGMQKLTVWYTRAIEAGIAEPASVTVTDEFAHSITVLFTPQSSNGVFSQNVSLAGMEGTVLHVNFTSTREWVGLGEIRVFAPAPLPPETPTGPIPPNGNVNVPVTTSLGWNASVGATSYDVYFWNSLDAEPSTATATVTTNTWTPTPGLIGAAEATYQWKVVAKNVHGDAPGPVWTFATSVITYTYVYEAGSVPPNVHAELATPSILNDGVVGTTWDSTTQLYGSGTATLDKPSMALTLSPYGSLNKLTVWYLSWTAAGVFVPDSLTVSDNFGHSTTTPFAPPAGVNAVFSQDVPLTGMQGSVLHLSFTCTQYWVGLDEIKVFGTAGGGSGYGSWASVHAGGQTAEKDFDHDGVPNGVEYFMDAPDGFTDNPGVVNGKVTWSRVNPVASFMVQVSDNLTDWSPANVEDVDLSDPSQVIYTLPIGAAKKFCRLAITP